MGKLITLDEARKDAKWYFPDATFSGRDRNGNSTYQIEWPNKAFPFGIAIHYDTLFPPCDSSNAIRVRKWIESSAISGTVIYTEKDNSYRVYYTDEDDYDKSIEIQNRWYIFYFEDEEDALAFKLTFSDIVISISNNHPTKHFGRRTVEIDE